MTHKGTGKNIASEFPALAQFFSGYLHQDFLEEYESPVAAAKAFCADAAAHEVAAVKMEWKAWRKQLAQASVDEAAAAIRRLGGAWGPQNITELEQLDAVFDVR